MNNFFHVFETVKCYFIVLLAFLVAAAANRFSTFLPESFSRFSASSEAHFMNKKCSND